MDVGVTQKQKFLNPEPSLKALERTQPSRYVWFQRFYVLTVKPQSDEGSMNQVDRTNIPPGPCVLSVTWEKKDGMSTKVNSQIVSTFEVINCTRSRGHSKHNLQVYYD